MKTKITFKEVEFEAEFDYQEAEPADNEYPGCSEEVDLQDIYHEGVSLFDIMEPYFEEIESLILKALK